MLWDYWLDHQWNKPDRTDHYLMQIAREVRRVLSTKPNDIQSSDFKIEFETVNDSKNSRKPTRTEAANASKARWLPHMKNLKVINK